MRKINVLKETKKARETAEKIKELDLYVMETGKLYKGNCHITNVGKIYSCLRPKSTCVRLTWVKSRKK